MKHTLTVWAILLLVPSGLCAAEPLKRSRSPTDFVDSDFARRLQAEIATMEQSEPQGWRDFIRRAYRLDGEYAELFCAACAHLMRRDPTLFLRRHLAGDPDAMFCAWSGYGWSEDYRAVLDLVWRYRLLEARTARERQKIREFIARTRDFRRLPPRPNPALERTPTGRHPSLRIPCLSTASSRRSSCIR